MSELTRELTDELKAVEPTSSAGAGDATTSNAWLRWRPTIRMFLLSLFVFGPVPSVHERRNH